jgi:hypothetical protein
LWVFSEILFKGLVHKGFQRFSTSDVLWLQLRSQWAYYQHVALHKSPIQERTLFQDKERKNTENLHGELLVCGELPSTNHGNNASIGGADRYKSPLDKVEIQ